ncbi:MAG: hypothetical protein HYX50_04615 [Chloroflexi bacterium]|nr:hypothetical protein [Chloroflexota bacterium]
MVLKPATARVIAALVVLMLLALTAVACTTRGGDGTGAAAQTSTAGSLDALDAPDALPTGDPSAAASTPRSGAVARPPCASPRPRPAGDVTETISSGGLERSYILHVPKSYTGDVQVPLVLNLHGFGSNATQQAIYSGLPAKADREGFIVISPEGIGTPKRWYFPAENQVDDVAFMRDLLDRAEATLCIDPARIFVAGMSNGAGMTTAIACGLPGRITAVAAVAALAGPATCAAGVTVPIITFRGTADACVPFTGGRSACGLGLPVLGAEDGARRWAQFNGCDSTPSVQQFSANVRTIGYSSCRNDAAVVLFIVDGGGHTWPGSIDVPRLGMTTQEVNATDQIWDFFVAQGNLRR